MRQYDHHFHFGRAKNWWGLAIVLSWSTLSFAAINEIWVVIVSMIGTVTWIALYADRKPVGVNILGGMLQFGIGDSILVETNLDDMTAFWTTVINCNGEDVVRIHFHYENKKHSYDFGLFPGLGPTNREVRKLHEFLVRTNPHLELRGANQNAT